MVDSVTVGIIAFNEEAKIRGCLQSLEFIKDHISGLQVIFVDNNSTDQTVAIAGQVLRDLQLNFTLIKRTQNSLAEARNDILTHTKTRWIYMIDADCKLDASTWPNLIRNWSNDSKIAARGGSQKFCPVHEILILLEEMRKSYLGHFGSAQMRSTGPVEFLEHISTTHILYDKEALVSVGGFNPLLKYSAEDLDISLRLRKKGFLLQFNPESFLWHEQAHTWAEWARKAFRNGLWQTRLIAYNAEILKTRRPWPGILLFLIPLVPVTALLIVTLIYTGVIFYLSFSTQLKFLQKIKLAGLFIMTHFLYATGEMLGFILSIKDLILKKTLPNSTKS